MNLKKAVLTICLICVSFWGTGLYAQGKLLFKSGFEKNTRIVADGNKHILKGKDRTTGYEWDNKGFSGKWNFFYLAGDEPEKYITTRIEEVTGRDGKRTSALRMGVKSDLQGDKFGMVTRNEFSYFTEEAFTEGYVSFWIKIQDDYLEKAPKTKYSRQLNYYQLDSWRMLMELKEPNSGVSIKGRGTNNYRTSFFIARDSITNKLYWLLRAEMPQPVRKIDYEIENREIEVPLGEWFKMEVYFKKDKKNGCVWWSVNNNKIAIYNGRTEHPDNPFPLKFWSFFKLYQDEKWLQKGEVYQWIDDFEFWSGWPYNETKD